MRTWGPADSSGPFTIVRAVDPNVSHPLRQMDVLARVQILHGKPLSTRTFQALVWKHGLKSRQDLCWEAKEKTLTRYSNDVVAWLGRLSAADVETALRDYRGFMKELASKKSKSAKL